MDHRVWQWKSPWEKRIYLLYSLFYLCLLLQERATAAEAGYRQESKNEVPDSNKLDSFSNYLPYYSKEDSDYKRGSAFFPLRGKKPFSDDSITPHQLYLSDETEDKRSQFYPLRGKKVPDDLKRGSYFMPMRGRKDDGSMEEDYDITEESPNKRASSFMPMRGKKKYAGISNYLNRAGTYSSDITEVLNPSNRHTYDAVDKRLHSFVPVRGKRSYKEYGFPLIQMSLTNNSHDDPVSDHSIEKRSVSFMPMRGRRKLDENPTGRIATSLLEKRDPMEESNGGTGSLDKKAAFTPMRGRRFDNEYDLGNVYGTRFSSKRAQSFMPMRGRRAHLRDIVFEGSNAPNTESKLIDDKRASSFMPMRGRKSETERTEHMESNLDKKASAFTLMRGRRSTDYSEDEGHSENLKRVSFMPMRGRRLVKENFDAEYLPEDQLMSLTNKRASAFMPMRGRRFVDENVTVDPWPPEQLMSLFNKRAGFMPMRGRRGDLDDLSQEPYETEPEANDEKRSSYFMPMRGRRYAKEMYFYNPYSYLIAGIGSSLMSNPYTDQAVWYNPFQSTDERRKKLKINWDAVKRAFHATRGKRFHEVDDYVQSLKDTYNSNSDRHTPTEDTGKDIIDDSREKTRTKRSIVRPRVAMGPNRQYIALKRPMSFFATRGKRFDDSAVDSLSKLH